MNSHIAAVEALLASLPGDVAYGDATGHTPPYVLLWSSAGNAGLEASVTGESGMSDLLGVTWVHTTPRNALALAALGRPLLDGVKPTVTGRSVLLTLESSEPVRVDRDVTLTTTNTHPAYIVDRFRLVSVPA